MFDWIQGRVRKNVAPVDTRFEVDPVPLYSPDDNDAFFSGEDASSDLYKYGFVACINGTAEPNLGRLKTINGWPVHAWSDWVVAHHPQTSLVCAELAGSQLAIIGEVFDPFSKEFDAQVIADSLCELAGNEPAFLERLDALSGRFVVLAQHGSEWFVYHDAFSSRSVYYNAYLPGVVASHAGLMAEITAEPVDFNVISFTISEAYRKRDVKYLPGCRTVFQNIFYCPANHRLNIFGNRGQRYWPRPDSVGSNKPEAELIQYLDGYGDFIRSHYDRELFGLTGGLDSRTLLAALAAKKMPMHTFTLYRGDQNGGNATDIALARDLASSLGLQHETLKIDFTRLNPEYFSAPVQIIRQNTGFARLNSAFSNAELMSHFRGKFPGESLSYSRGFGGEILRGFYQGRAHEIQAPTADAFSRAYDVMQGSPFVRASFQHFIDSSDFSHLHGVDINDVFYWEHRMSGWGALAIAETDLTARTFAGYNSRRLYSAFLRMPIEERLQRKAFKGAIAHFKPELLEFDVE